MVVKIVYLYVILVSLQGIWSAAPSPSKDIKNVVDTKKAVQMVQSHISSMEDLEQAYDTWLIENESNVKHSIFELKVLLMMLGVPDHLIEEFDTSMSTINTQIESSRDQFKHGIQILQTNLEEMLENLRKHEEKVPSYLTNTKKCITDMDYNIKQSFDILVSLNNAINKQVNNMLQKQSGILADEVHYHLRLLQEILNSEKDKLEHHIKKYNSSKDQNLRQLNVVSKKIIIAASKIDKNNKNKKQGKA